MAINTLLIFYSGKEVEHILHLTLPNFPMLSSWFFNAENGTVSAVVIISNPYGVPHLTLPYNSPTNFAILQTYTEKNKVKWIYTKASSSIPLRFIVSPL